MHIVNNLSGTCFQNGYNIVNHRGTAIIGMSPGNSYFKQDTVQTLLEYSAQLFSHIIIMIPDTPAVHTYKAMGYESIKAERIARHAGSLLRRRSQASIDTIKANNSMCDITILNWAADIEPDYYYLSQKEAIYDLYERNQQFRHDVRSTTQEVIAAHLKHGNDLEHSCDQGVHYLLEELAFLTAWPLLVKQPITYVYHNRWPVWEKFINGDYDGIEKELGFTLIK